MKPSGREAEQVPSDDALRLGVIGGSAFLEAAEVTGAEIREVATPAGDVKVHVGADFAFLRRHGEGVYHPPHRIPHRAHVLALESLGVRQVAAFNSTGSLHRALGPGDVVVPDDYLSFQPPPTFALDEYLHIVPSLDEGMRALLIRAAEAALASRDAVNPAEPLGRVTPRLERTGVYAETRGPRFETPAEVRLLQGHARVVGMTAASEATLFQERGIGYGVLCIVDNWANGVGPAPLTLEAFQKQLARSGSLARAVLAELLRLWRGRSGSLAPDGRTRL